MGEPADMVGALKFLLSDDAGWITGHVLNVDGGQVMRV
jgi:NAD(P)-dependent dehydrogenase (short-subunit alcohol dehydrogenase family)